MDVEERAAKGEGGVDDDAAANRRCHASRKLDGPCVAEKRTSSCEGKE